MGRRLGSLTVSLEMNDVPGARWKQKGSDGGYQSRREEQGGRRR